MPKIKLADGTVHEGELIDDQTPPVAKPQPKSPDVVKMEAENDRFLKNLARTLEAQGKSQEDIKKFLENINAEFQKLQTRNDPKSNIDSEENWWIKMGKQCGIIDQNFKG